MLDSEQNKLALFHRYPDVPAVLGFKVRDQTVDRHHVLTRDQLDLEGPDKRPQEDGHLLVRKLLTGTHPTTRKAERMKGITVTLLDILRREVFRVEPKE